MSTICNTRGLGVTMARASACRPPSVASTFLRLTIADLRQALLARWFVLYTAAFVTLGLGISYVSAMAAGSTGLDGFGRTSAGLINLVILIVPLMALTAGASAIAPQRERGSLAYLLVQPVSRGEVLGARFVGLSLAMVASISLGFGLSGLILSLKGGAADPGSLVRLASLAVVLAMAMVAPGIAISVMTRRSSVASGIAVFVWLALVFGSDLGLMAAAGAMHLRAQELFYAGLASPLQVFKMWALCGTDATLDILGPAGLYATDTFGARLPWLFSGAMAAWIVLPLAAAWVIFTRRSQ
ncbi:MAG: ABC transporter permease [Phycisphaerales bacterium]|nr:ABC transporter permease [Phycisphaerales bacterium]